MKGKSKTGAKAMLLGVLWILLISLSTACNQSKDEKGNGLGLLLLLGLMDRDSTPTYLITLPYGVAR